MSITITKELHWYAAHRVTLHESKCKNLHGHNYRAAVTVESWTGALDSAGRVIDFSEIRATLGEWIDDKWDHGLLLAPSDVELREYADSHSWKFYTFEHEPTTEVIAMHLGQIAQKLLPSSVRVVEVVVHETPTFYATWRP